MGMNKPAKEQSTEQVVDQPVDQRQNQFIISAIMFGLLVWGAFLAIGAFIFEFDLRKGLIVYGFTIAFLLFWAVALATRRRRLRMSAENAEENVTKSVSK